METGSQNSLPSQEAIESAEKLYNAIHTAFPEAEADFESKWTAWDAICHSQTTSVSSIDPCIQTDKFKVLERLGPKIIPFIVFKLARNSGQNSHGVFLYNTLENDTNYRVNLDEAIVSKEVLQRDSSRIVELNYKRNKMVEEHVRAWKDHCQNQFSSHSAAYTDCEPYWDLCDMGPSIIAHLMVEYYHRRGFWFELLHEIIHGRKMGASTFMTVELFEVWYQWFNKGEHDQMPVYIPTAWDRRFFGEIGD